MELLIDALLDSIKILPFLILVYLLIGYLEENTNNRLYRKLIGTKWIGPIIGSTLGCLPQCGFSVVGANLYSRRMISLGTLMAIFISTSDEAIPILLAHPGMAKSMLIVLVMKLVLAMIIGLTVEVIMQLSKSKVQINTKASEIKNVEVAQGCGCQGGCSNHKGSVLKGALLHSLKVFAYILVINLILNAIIEGIGEDSLSSILLINSMWQPALAALVGLIPNCASSIVLTEMYIAGSLSLGSLIAGLMTGAGIGLVILFKANKNLLENIKIVGILYVSGVVFGMLIQLI